MIAAGKLRHRVTIEQPGITTGVGGAQTETWTTVATVRGEMREDGGTEGLGGRELDGEGFARSERQLAAELGIRFVMRYRSGITPTMRIKDADGNLYDIVAVMDRDGRRRELELRLLRRVA